MKTIQSVTIIAAVLIIIVCGSVTVAGQMQIALGSIVPLSGYSPYQTVYLFLTGPNLPANGVALDNVYRPADNGGATQVDVNSDGQWSYKWNTGSAGGKLDAGVYTVWVADGPADLSHLQSVDYNTISVVLSNPTITAGISTQPGLTPAPQSPPGSMNLTSDPTGASVVVNNAYRGSTPLSVTGLDPGTYTVMFSRFGYEKLSTPVTIESGSETDVNVVLKPAFSALAVNTSPAGAELTVDGMYAGFSPATLANITPGNHTLTVTKAGYTTQNIPVPAIAGQTMQVQVALAPAALPGTRAAGLVPATILACGAVILLVVSRRNR